MNQTSSNRARVVGDYIVGKQIGSGSFSVVWHARHRIHGLEVAIKEIVMDRLSKKLQDNLLQEIDILRKINHPNIIRLFDIIEVPGRINLVLEYCRGGDLSRYIQRHERIPEDTAKHFMKQLAAGLQILRQNNLIHRDLKPQNLLLTANDNHAVLKIADFGFARSLQPRGLAETLCGSPLYMAPEIMQLQKYDAKLLQNILKSNELCFPQDSKDLTSDCIDLCQKLLRRNPVERLTFEEFFNHAFLSQKQSQESFSPSRHVEGSPPDDNLPFILDDDSSYHNLIPSSPETRNSMRCTYGFYLGKEGDKVATASNTSRNVGSAPSSRLSSTPPKIGSIGFKIEDRRSSDANMKESITDMSQRPSKACPEVWDLEFIDEEYVVVPGPPLEVSSSSIRQHKLLCKSESIPVKFVNNTSAPVPIVGAAGINTCGFESLESRSSTPSGSHGSMDIGDSLEQPSAHPLTRIRSLRRCASAIRELVNDKVEAGKQLEAFSIQLVILAVWKQALLKCHTYVASVLEGSPNQESARVRRSTYRKHSYSDSRGSPDKMNAQGPQAVCSQIERDFLFEVGQAEELSKSLDPIDGAYSSSIRVCSLGLLYLHIVDELMGVTETAYSSYSKSVHLLVFLPVEAPSLILNPSFFLTNTDRI
ncbi:hypothetical protein MKX01_004810 [Papaver californicum]|nr:hypothetical protein MKX01_004810 [Papaver californicum]